ncbi:MAG: caspase family protein [Spirochaetaceae bacterium]|nr:hypothetical protein [Spirochaetaceae bacterium]MBP3448837.1 caspase family protein [Spirochaetaceae bacterium]MBQ3023838.1 caspase family protein [Spirochaetaceae bacterium]MBQ7905792.1 caspase family protein [Spirochaetaceae bacterium]
MQKIKLFLCLFLVLIISSIVFASENNESLSVERYALYVAANNGGAERDILKYAASDAKKLMEAMQEIGGINQDNSVILVEPKITDVENALQSFATTINQKKSNARRTEFIFYYSGHSDENALLLGEESYGYSQLKADINSVPSDIHVVMLDSCFSGNFIRAKGGSRQKSFLVDDSSVVSGHAYLSSSSESEASQESDLIQSSYFTHALITGLRGAADSSGDNKVSLNELYYYAFNETLSQTEQSTIGTQHPSFDITLVGSGDLILSDISTAESILALDSDLLGTVYIRNEKTGQLISEVKKSSANVIPLALEAGTYNITLIQSEQTLGASVKLKAGKSVYLSAKKFKKIDTKDGRARGGKKIPAMIIETPQEEKPYKDLPETESAEKFEDLNDGFGDIRSNAMDAIKKLQKK